MSAPGRGAPGIAVALATSGSVGSVAVAEAGRVLRLDTFSAGMVHGREIVQRLRRAFDELGLRPEAIELVAADLGPGSFTGMRVGAATAKALAFGAGARVAGVRSTDAIARNLPASRGDRCVVVDAKRGELYCAVYRVADGRLEDAPPIRRRKPCEIADTVPRDCLLLGDGLEPAGAMLREAGFALGEREAWLPRADRVLELGLEAWRAGCVLAPEALAPLYLRPTPPVPGGRAAPPAPCS